MEEDDNKIPGRAEWLELYPTEEDREQADISKCPAQLRVHFECRLLDGKFEFPETPWTLQKHQEYINIQSRREVEFNRKMTKFVQGPGRYYFKRDPSIPTSNAERSWNFVDFVDTPHRRKPKRKISESEADFTNREVRMISNCLPFINGIVDFESSLLQQILSPTERPLMDLEDTLLSIASYPKACDGIFYCASFVDEETRRQYHRYFEAGWFENFMFEMDVMLDDEDSEHYHWQVFNKSDIEQHRDVQQAKIDRSKSKKPSRPFQHFVNNVYKNKTSVSKSVSAFKTQVETFVNVPNLKFHGVVIYVVPYGKQHIDNIQSTTEKSQKDNEKPYLHVAGAFDEKLVQTKLSLFVTQKITRDVVNTMSDDPSVRQQASFINALPNSHTSQNTVRFKQRFIDESQTPASKRAKLMHHALNGAWSEVNLLVDAQPEDSNDINPPNVSTGETRQHLKRLKSVRVTKDDLGIQEQREQAPNMFSEETTLYGNFRKEVISDRGSFYMRIENEHTTVFTMNDYDAESGMFKPNLYVHCSCTNTELGPRYTCNCRVQTSIRERVLSDQSSNVVFTQGVQCCHCRFFEEEITPLINNRTAQNMSLGSSPIAQKLKSAITAVHKNVCELACSVKNTRKFSVVNEDIASFVHITLIKSSNRYIASCMASVCDIGIGNKRSLNRLASTSDLCPHLNIFKEKKVLWEAQVSCDEHDTDEEDDDTMEEPEAVFDGAFDVSSGQWKYPCESTHSPKPDGDEALSKAILHRDMISDLNPECIPRVDGCLRGHKFIPPIPENTCRCQAGWTSLIHPNGIEELTRKLVVFASHAPLLCEVFSRRCVAGTCMSKWDEGKNDCIHVVSSDTAAGDEIGWLFVDRVISCGQTFSAFTEEMTKVYARRNKLSRKFMSTNLFIRWFFSWAANHRYEFRQQCVSCGENPSVLACDGTRIGICIKNAKFTSMESVDVHEDTLVGAHRRNDRCFLPYDNENKSKDKDIRECREHLRAISSKVDGIYPHQDDSEESKIILKSLKSNLPEIVFTSVKRFYKGKMPAKEGAAFAKLLQMFGSTTPVNAIVPPSFLGDFKLLLQFINSDESVHMPWIADSMCQLREYSPEIHDLLTSSKRCHKGKVHLDIVSLLSHLEDRVSSLQYIESAPAASIEGTYNPPKLARAYYFNRNGTQIRKTRKFDMDANKTAGMHDDNPMAHEMCSKFYPGVSSKGTTFTFFWFCPLHHHCYGFHMISGSEGRKDPACSLYAHLEQPPNTIFYDFACSLHEYTMNRESGYFKNVRFFHDIFHGYSHKCAHVYRSQRLLGFEYVNSEICEQFNSFMQVIKRSATQMTQEHFTFYLQFFIYIWNTMKRERYNRRLQIALAGAE